MFAPDTADEPNAPASDPGSDPPWSLSQDRCSKCRGDEAEQHAIELPLTEQLLDRLRAAGY